MKVLIVFNHPAPYKVLIFNELCKYVDLTVLFERNKAKNRPDEFYSMNKYDFKSITLTDSYIGNEGSLSNNVKKYIKEHHEEFDLIDNPWADRPSELVFNGWVTDYTGAVVSLDIDTYVKTPLTGCYCLSCR